MAVDLRLYIVPKKDFQQKSDILSPHFVLEMIERRPLVEDIKGWSAKYGKNVPNPLIIDLFEESVSLDRYGDTLRYVDCNDLSHLIISHHQYDIDKTEKHRNEIIAEFLSPLKKDYYCVLFWR